MTIRNDSKLPEPLAHGLSSKAARASDDAAIARMQAHLEASLGAAFDQEVARPSANRSASQLRRFGWLGAGAIVAACIGVWSARPVVPTPESDPQPTAAATLQPAAASATLPTPPQPDPSPVPFSAPSDIVAKPPADSALSQHDAARTRPVTRASTTNPRAKPEPAGPGANVPAELGLADELSGVDHIRSLMAKSPQRALAAVEQQQQQFSRGALGPERELLRLDALLRLNRTAEAEQLAQQLLAAPGNQPYRANTLKLLNRPR